MRGDLKIAYRANVAHEFSSFCEPGFLNRSLPRCYTKFLSVDVSKSLTRAALFVLAFNTRTNIEEENKLSEQFPNVEADAQRTGFGQRIEPVSLFIHESSENLAFQAQQGYQTFDYPSAHTEAMHREAVIKHELRIPGGFAGGQIRTTIRQ